LMSFGLSFEVEHLVDRATDSGWQPWQLKQIAWTMLWSAAVSIFAALVARLEPDRTRRSGWLRAAWIVCAALVGKYLLIDTLVYRLLYGPAAVTTVANFEVLAGAIVTGGLIYLSRLLARGSSSDPATDDSRLRI